MGDNNMKVLFVFYVILGVYKLLLDAAVYAYMKKHNLRLPGRLPLCMKIIKNRKYSVVKEFYFLAKRNRRLLKIYFSSQVVLTTDISVSQINIYLALWMEVLGGLYL